MPEHLIRLRGAWDLQVAEGPTATRRITLPTDWLPGLATPFRLIRHFGSPPVDPEQQTLSLCMKSVAGLTQVWLNDRLIVAPAADSTELEVVLDEPLRARNVLMLEVNPALWVDDGAKASAWGSIALVIRSP